VPVVDAGISRGLRLDIVIFSAARHNFSSETLSAYLVAAPHLGSYCVYEDFRMES
jgi:hypothetical protein